MKAYAKIWSVLRILCFINMFGFFVFYFAVGGSASHIADGVYYVANHGVLTAVSESVYNISAVWQVVFFAGVLLHIIGEGIYQTYIKNHKSER